MGQAKARGTPEQRRDSAIERNRIAREKRLADIKAREEAEARALRQAAKDRAEREQAALARGEVAPERVRSVRYDNRHLMLAAGLALAATSALR